MLSSDYVRLHYDIALATVQSLKMNEFLAFNIRHFFFSTGGLNKWSDIKLEHFNNNKLSPWSLSHAHSMTNILYFIQNSGLIETIYYSRTA